MRWFKRYFNYAKFPPAAKETLRKALIGEGIVLAFMAFVAWRLEYLQNLTLKIGGDLIELSGGGSYVPGASSGPAAAPSWENFLIGEFADRVGLSLEKLEIGLVYALLGAALIAFGTIVYVLDWRKPREEHYRPTLYILTFVNMSIALVAASVSDSKVASVVAIGAQSLIVVLLLLKPAARAGWMTRV